MVEDTFHTLIFLDVDGVLNNSFECKVSKDPPHVERIHPFRTRSWFHADMMLRLSKIVKETDAKIVVSSTWRKGMYDYVAKMLDDFLIEQPIGATPYSKVTGQHWGNYQYRGDEIAWYLLQHYSDDELSNIRIIILDDSDDMGVLEKEGVFVRTGSYVGLTDETVQAAISTNFGNISHLIQEMKEIDWLVHPREPDACKISCNGYIDDY
jgi:hypothetical protein